MNVIGSILFIGFLVLGFFVLKAEDERNEEAGIKEYINFMPASWVKWGLLVSAFLLLYFLLTQA